MTRRAPGAGRPPKPTALKVLQGTDRPSRVRADEPTPAPGAPEIPEWLDADDEADVWSASAKELLGFGVLTRGDGPALVMLVTGLIRYRDAWRAYRVEGAIGDRVTQSGSHRVRTPEAVELDAALRHLVRLCSEFGVGPSARTRVGQVAPPKETDRDAVKRRLFGTP